MIFYDLNLNKMKNKNTYMNTNINLKDINLNNNYNEHVLINKKDEKGLSWERLNKINSMVDGFRSIIFFIQFVFILFVIISIIVVFNKINNVIKYIEDLPNIIKNGVTSIF